MTYGFMFGSLMLMLLSDWLGLPNVVTFAFAAGSFLALLEIVISNGVAAGIRKAPN